MVRPLRVAPARPAIAPEESVDRKFYKFSVKEIWQALPAWLSSLVWHLSLMLVLGLLAVAGGGMGRGGGVGISLTPGGAEGDGGEDLTTVETAGVLADVAHPGVVAQIEEVRPEISPLVEAELARTDLPIPTHDIAGLATTPRRASGQGHGSGKGDGEGNGEGEGGDSGLGLVPVRTRIFDIPAEGTRFVYVFDRSESMNALLSYSSEGETVFSITPLAAAKAELLRSLDDLDPRQRFQIVYYNHMPTIFDSSYGNPKLLAATKENKRRAATFVGQMVGQGATYHLEPLEIALRMRPDVIFLLTDGEAKDDPAPYFVNQLKRQNKGHTKINVIQFCFAPREGGTLAQLARENGGQHVFFNISRLGPGLPGGPQAAPPTNTVPPANTVPPTNTAAPELPLLP